MTTWNKQIENRNFLSPIGFKFSLAKFPKISYFCQTANIPSMNLGIQEQPTPFRSLPLEGFIEYDPLTLSFLVDEDLQNFVEIYNWIDSIVPLSDPELYGSFTGTAKSNTNVLQSIANDLNQYSDITLVINTNKNIANRYIRFHDAFPIALGSIELESGADAEPALVNVSFRFSYYDIATKS